MTIAENFADVLAEIDGKTDDYREILVLLLTKINIDSMDLLSDLREANWHDADIAEIASEVSIFKETDIYAELNLLFQAVRHTKDSELRDTLNSFFSNNIGRNL